MIDYNEADYLIDLIFDKNTSSDIVLEYMKQYPTCAQYKGYEGFFPLQAACSHLKCGNDVRMKLIKLYPSAVFIPNMDGYYPLHMACCNNNKAKEVIMKLIEIFPEAAKNAASISGSYPLNCAIRNIRCPKVILSLIKLYPKALQHKDLQGCYPIHHALFHGLANNIIQRILNVDPLSIQRQNSNGESFLQLHYPDRLNIFVMKHMTRYFDKNLINMTSNRDKCTPLNNACKYGREDMVEFLLQYPGIDVNAKHKYEDSTPLHCALDRSSTNIMKQLLRHPCIIHNDKNSNNETPLDLVNKHIQSIEKYNINGDYQCPKLPGLIEVKKLLEDFVVERRWKAFHYHLLRPGVVNFSRK